MSDHIKVGQVYASTHSGDVENGWRQRRHVVAVDLRPDVGGPREPSFVKLQSEHEDGRKSPPSRVRLRGPRARTIPGHRLIEDVAA